MQKTVAYSQAYQEYIKNKMLHFLMGIKSFKNWKRIAKSAANKSFILIRFNTHTHTCMSYECVKVWVTPEKGSAPQRLQVSRNIFYTIFICPQSFALLLFSLFTIFFTFLLRKVQHKASVAKTNSPQTKWVCGVWYRLTAHWPRWEWETRRNKRRSKWEKKYTRNEQKN